MSAVAPRRQVSARSGWREQHLAWRGRARLLRRAGGRTAEWAEREAAVACFADPGAYAHGDRDPSCSVNVESGVWHCWGCGAAGGAYDAALACGRRPREAIDLLIAHGLATRRDGPPKRVGASRHPLPPAAAPGNDRSAHHEPGASTSRELAIGEQELAAACQRLAGLVWPPRVLRQEQRRVWSRAVLLELGCGSERGRVIVPIRDAAGGLRGVLRYAPSHDHGAEGVGGARHAAGADPPPLRGIVDMGCSCGGAAGHDQRPLARAARDRGAER